MGKWGHSGHGFVVQYSGMDGGPFQVGWVEGREGPLDACTRLILPRSEIDNDFPFLFWFNGSFLGEGEDG